MNDSEQRRRELLQQTRNLYSDRRMPPPVHPRYGAAYSELYSDTIPEEPGTFGIRAMICFLLFAVFVTMDYQGKTIADVSSDNIVSAVEEQVDVEAVWKSL